MLSQIKFSKKWQKNLEITTKPYNFALAFEKHRDVAQSGLEYSSGGRVVASSNLVIPTKLKALNIKHLARFSKLFLLPLAPTFRKSGRQNRVNRNLTAKIFYKTKKDATQRVMDTEKSLLLTSETYSSAPWRPL